MRLCILCLCVILFIYIICYRASRDWLGAVLFCCLLCEVILWLRPVNFYTVLGCGNLQFQSSNQFTVSAYKKEKENSTPEPTNDNRESSVQLVPLDLSCPSGKKEEYFKLTSNTVRVVNEASSQGHGESSGANAKCCKAWKHVNFRYCYIVFFFFRYCESADTLWLTQSVVERPLVDSLKTWRILGLI